MNRSESPYGCSHDHKGILLDELRGSDGHKAQCDQYRCGSDNEWAEAGVFGTVKALYPDPDALKVE